MTRSDTSIIAGLVLTSLTVFVLLNSGRIDIIDGQWRFEVAYSLANDASLEIQDPNLRQWGLAGKDGARYSFYGVAGSLLGLPLVALAVLLAPGNRDLAQFLFSQTSSILGAIGIGLLFFIYRRLGVPANRATLWALVLAFGTLYLPLAISTFDQVQNAVVLLAALVATHCARRAGSVAIALVGSLAFAILVNFRDAYMAFLPAMLFVAGIRFRRPLLIQFRGNLTAQICLIGGIVGAGTWIGVSLLRFGTLVPPAPSGYHPPLLGNPLAGLAVLTVSPGKGILWYSPTIVFCLLGWRRFRAAHDELAGGVLVATACWVALVASLTFAGGDWCWGPRYWVVVLPLLFLAAPYAEIASRTRRILAVFLIGLGLSIQLLASAVDHQRFFFERGLAPFFWYVDESFYFRESALLARVGEIRRLDSPAATDVRLPFRPGPYPESLTYAIFGPSKDELKAPADWLARFKVFSLPRPWPLWSAALPGTQTLRWRSLLIRGLVLTGAIGIVLLAWGLMRRGPISPHGTANRSVGA